MVTSLIELPIDLIERCRAYAKTMVDDYAAGRNANSRAVSCFDAHLNVDLQALARMAECAFCIWSRCDFEKLSWTRFPDDGADVNLPAIGRVDVKHTEAGRFLIWPVAKNHIFDSKRFDAFVLMIGERRFEFAGWIYKDEFRRWKRIAGDGEKLAAGTRYMDRRDLRTPENMMLALGRGS